MTLNTTKCKSMRVSRYTSTHYPRTYSLNNIPLPSADNYKYLGVYSSSNLSWNMQVEYVTNNASRTLGYCYIGEGPDTIYLNLGYR